MTYKLLIRNKTSHDWETFVWESESVENLTEDQCLWWWGFCVYDSGFNPRILKIVSNDFDASTLNSTNDDNESYYIELGIME